MTSSESYLALGLARPTKNCEQHGEWSTKELGTEKKQELKEKRTN
jgi:hypothetical protein